MKYQDKPHKKTEDKKSFITKLREKEQREIDRLEKTDDKKNEDDSEKVDDNSQWLKKISGEGFCYIDNSLESLFYRGFFVL